MNVRRAGIGMAAAMAALAVACGPQGTGGQAGPAGSASAGPSTASAPAQTSPSTLTPQQQPSGATSTPAGPDRCHTGELTAALGNLDAGAGNRYAVLTLTSKADHPCVIFGYGGVGLLAANKKPVPTKQVRDPKVGPVRISLQPGASAKSMLHWSVVPSGDEDAMGPCEPAAAFLQVIPPDETEPLTIAFPPTSVCQHGRIDQTAYRPA
jgi:hypothetical protein